MYYSDRPAWIRIMKNAIGKNAYYFNTHVMMRRYVTEAYHALSIPAIPRRAENFPIAG